MILTPAVSIGKTVFPEEECLSSDEEASLGKLRTMHLDAHLLASQFSVFHQSSFHWLSCSLGPTIRAEDDEERDEYA